VSVTPGRSPRLAASPEASSSTARAPLQDLVGAIDEDGVDVEAHEGGVDGGSRPEQHSLTRGKAAPAKEAAKAMERRLREETALTHDVSVVIRQCDLRQCHVDQYPTWMWS
jgi:hypothetical protein